MNRACIMPVCECVCVEKCEYASKLEFFCAHREEIGRVVAAEAAAPPAPTQAAKQRIQNENKNKIKMK